MATHRKPNTSSSSAASSNQYHTPVIKQLPQSNHPDKTLGHTHQELVEAVMMLYDSHYSDEQFDEAFKHFHQHVEFMDPGLHLHSRLDMKAQFTYLRRWFTQFHPLEAHIATNADWVYCDLKMNWQLFGGRVSLKVHHILRVHVEAGLVVMMEDVWSTNDRVGAILGAVGLYEPIRWLISYPSTKYMRWQLGY